MRIGKLDFTCQGLKKCACGNGKDTDLHANKGNKHAKQKISKSTCQRKKKADTQKEENKKLRVAEKKGGHAKKRK